MNKHIINRNGSQPTRHIVIAVHGIRTFADWYGRLRDLLLEQNPKIEIEKLHFGYFSFFLLIFPWFRRLAAERFAGLLIDRLRELDGHKVDIVAHSFGTFIVATALERIKREAVTSPNTPIIKNLILSGSVLKHSFAWREFCPRFVGRIINDCGTHDIALLFSMFFLVGLGYGGRRGFDGIENLQFFNRFFEFGHSGFFKKNGKPYDQFMIENWLPIFLRNQVPEVVDPRNVSRKAWWYAWLETWADPLKMAVHVVIFLMLPFSGWWLYNEEREANMLAKANLDAAHSLATVNGDGSQALRRALWAAEKYDSPEINQALKASVDIAALPTSRIKHNSVSGISRAAAHPQMPIFAVSYTVPGRTIVSIIDAPSGRELAFFSASMKEEDSCHINSLPNQVRFSPKGNYVILESIAGACIWSIPKEKIIFSDVARERIEMSADEDVALLMDGSVSGKKRLDLLDLFTGNVRSIAKMPIRPFDDIKLSAEGLARISGEKLILSKFGHLKDQTVLADHLDRFKNVFVSSYSDVVVATTEKGEMVAVESSVGKVLWRKAVGKDVANIDFSRDGTRIAGQYSDGSSVILRITDGMEIASFSTTGFPEGISFVGASSNLVLTNNRHHDLKIWNVETRSLWRKIPRDIYQEGSAITSTGDYLVAGGRDKTAVVWNLTSRELNATYFLKLGAELSAIAIDAEGKSFITLDANGSITFGDVQQSETRTSNDRINRRFGVRQSVALSNRGSLGVVETNAGVVKVFNMLSGELQWSAVLPRLASHTYQRGTRTEEEKVEIHFVYPEKEKPLPIECPVKNNYLVRAGHNEEKISWKNVYRTCSIRSISDADQEKVFATSFYAGWSRISPSGKYVLVSVLDMLMVLDSQDGHILSKLSLGYDSRTNDVFALDLGNGFRFQRLKKLEFLEDDSIVALTESSAVSSHREQHGLRLGRSEREV
ncbi:WD40 repeat domain-containing protein [Herbaspirillum huttiense]|uniref:WD40 repeat domain-containing protein n=1 Tax=Herbaspirillum huttiense TaxID=863372 RepID=UPI000415B7D9|nr:WD40 repeat domain-containing protein [Herbaspirillum huttiense]